MSDYQLISLTQGKVAIVDAADYEWLNQWKWYAVHSTGNLWYATRKVFLPWRKQKEVRMHRVLIEARKGMRIDHIDGNGLNNRLSNLRLATDQQNGCNRGPQINNKSGYKGVSWSKECNKWLACIHLHKRTIKLGFFLSKEEAAQAYAEAAKALHGDFARTKWERTAEAV